jgi:hypothetical protein
MAWASVRCKPQALATLRLASPRFAALRRASRRTARHRAPSHLGAHPTTCCRRMSRAGDNSAQRAALQRLAPRRHATHVTEGPLGAPHPRPL